MCLYGRNPSLVENLREFAAGECSGMLHINQNQVLMIQGLSYCTESIQSRHISDGTE